ncbi:MAG: hypothetical protein LBT91_00565 [Bifidobacteriaceae bacterium]|jgi:hypothetical protein|nr:hypothetical protein [Bifidobacteriaceae bacterium]
MKILKLKKLATAFNIFILVSLGFISGNYIQVSAADSSAAVLPITRGGTGANSETSAAANILSTNFANYNGVLPVAKGGTGSNINDTKSLFQAQINLGLPPTYIYQIEYANRNKSAYQKFYEGAYDSGSDVEYNLVLEITGGKIVTTYNKKYDVYMVGKKYSSNLFFNITGYGPDCTTSDGIGFYTKDENNIYKFYYFSNAWSSFTRLTWQQYGYAESPYSKFNFTPEIIYTIPSGATYITANKCV